MRLLINLELRKVSSFLPACLLVSLLAVACQAQSPANPMPAPWKQLPATNAFDKSSSFPIIANDYMVSFERISFKRTPASVTVFPLAGGPQIQFTFLPPDASSAAIVQINDASVNAAHQVVLAGFYLKSVFVPAEAPGNTVDFIALVDFSGRILAMLDLADFEPERICSSTDGTFWALGQVWKAEMGHADYQLLRNFTQKGSAVGTFLSRSSVPTEKNVNFRPHNNVAFLACANDGSVGAFLGPTSTWTEVVRGAATTWQVNRAAGPLTGIVMLTSQKVYATMNLNAKNALVKIRSLSALQFGNGATANWSPVTESGGSHSTVLVGRDRNSLVSLMASTDPSGHSDRDLSGNMILYWITPK